MRASRIVLNLVVVAAAVFLSGCYVATQKLPAGDDAIDQQLIGAWRALDSDGKPTNDAAFLHFVKPQDAESLVMVFADDSTTTTYEMHSIKVGKRMMFALKILSSTQKGADAEEPNYILGYYDVKGEELSFNLMGAKQLKPFVDAGKIKGVAEKKEFGKVTLTASPQELAAFFASTDQAALIGTDPPSRARRVAKPEKQE